MKHVAYLPSNTICNASISKNLCINFLLFPNAQNPNIENIIEMDLYAKKNVEKKNNGRH